MKMRLAQGVCCIAILIILFAIHTSRPSVAYNSGAREKLASSLQTIQHNLMADGQEPDLPFILSRFDSPTLPTLEVQKRWIENHGVRLNWHNGQEYSEAVFYPVALLPNPEIDDKGGESSSPLVAMVPISQGAIENLLELLDCDREESESAWRACRATYIERLFESNGIGDATVLMSDGNVLHVPIAKMKSWWR